MVRLDQTIKEKIKTVKRPQQSLGLNQAKKLNGDEVWKLFQRQGWIDGVDRKPNPNIIDGVHRGEACAVIGSGFSAKGIDYSSLKNLITIAINHVIEVYTNPDYLIFQDHRFLRINKYDLNSFNGTMVIANNNPMVKEAGNKNIITFMPTIDRKKIPKSIANGLYHRKSTGLCALNLAIIMGCNPIYLLGCDMPRDYRETYNPEDGVHLDKNYRGGVDTMQALEQYEATFELYEPFGKYQDRIINVCENGIIPWFKQMTMANFNKKIGEMG